MSDTKQMASNTSIIMCTYNGAQYIDSQLASIASQTVLPFELIVADDGSTDTTLSLVQRFSERVAFPVRVLRNPSNLGFTANFLSASCQARGEFVAFCDQDDIWMPQKIEFCQEVLTTDPQATLVIHSGQVVDRTGTLQNRRHPDISHSNVFEKLAPPLLNGMVPGFALVFRRIVSDVLWAAWPHKQYEVAYNKYGNLLGHDILTYASARSMGRIHSISDPLVYYRVHGGNVTARVEALVPGQSNVGAALKQALSPTAETYRQMSERWGTEVNLLSAAITADSRLGGLSMLRTYLGNQSKMFGWRSVLYEEPSLYRRVKLFSRMVTAGAYRDRNLGYLGAQSALKDGAATAGLLPRGAGKKQGQPHHA